MLSVEGSPTSGGLGGWATIRTLDRTSERFFVYTELGELGYLRAPELVDSLTFQPCWARSRGLTLSLP